MYVKGFALECKYMSKKGKTTLSYTSETRKAFLAAESALPKTSIVIVTLGKGVAASAARRRSTRGRALDLGVHAAPRQTGNDAVGILKPEEVKVQPKVFRTVANDMNSPKTAAEPVHGAGVEFHRNERRMGPPSPPDGAGDGPGAGSEFDDDLRGFQVGCGEHGRGEPSRAWRHRPDRSWVADKRGEEMPGVAGRGGPARAGGGGKAPGAGRGFRY